MTKLCSKYFYIMAITMISLGLFNAGCTNQQIKTATLETKIDNLSHSVEGLEPQISDLKKKLDAQVAEFEASLSAQGNAHKLLEKRVSDSGILIKEIKQNMDLVEEDKSKMKVQLNEIGSHLNRLETVSKITERKQHLQKELLNGAIKLYRQQRFKEAISKWEEVLAQDPDRLEAKFNIEIAKDRIKQIEKDKSLKSMLVQRKYKNMNFFTLTLPSSSRRGE